VYYILRRYNLKVYIHNNEKIIKKSKLFAILYSIGMFLGALLMVYCFSKFGTAIGIMSIVLYLIFFLLILLFVGITNTTYVGSYVLDVEKNILYYISPVYVRDNKFHFSKFERIKSSNEANRKYKENIEYTRDENFLLDAVSLYKEYPEKLAEYMKKKEINVEIEELKNPRVVRDDEEEVSYVISYLDQYGKTKRKEIPKIYFSLSRDLKGMKTF